MTHTSRDAKAWGCRIGRITMKAGGAAIHRLPQFDADDMVRTVHGSIDEAYACLPGTIQGFALVAWDEVGNIFSDFENDTNRPIHDVPAMVKAAVQTSIAQRLCT
jgi:hypothetical protein